VFVLYICCLVTEAVVDLGLVSSIVKRMLKSVENWIKMMELAQAFVEVVE
jgi:hypothetical protein